MRILTYPNPFELNSNSELWSIITKYPHFCASDTLVQGLESSYTRTSFKILRTMESLINKCFDEFINNPQNDIQFFLDISEKIRKISDSEMQASFRYNIAEVVESIKLMIMLECDSKKFNKNLSAEQQILLEIYDEIIKNDLIKLFNSYKSLTKNELVNAIKSTILDEIEFSYSKKIEEFSNLDIYLPIKNLADGLNVVKKMKNHLIKQSDDLLFSFNSQNIENEIQYYNFLELLIADKEESNYDKIIIHGVHKITPIMFFLFNLLEKSGIEVIFLFNYAKNLPNVFQTWKEVYDWCDIKFEFAEDLDITKGKKLGVSFAKIIEGKKTNYKLEDKVTVYSNLTTFTDREVRPVFKRTLDKKNKNYNLSKMKKQYYAVHGETSNEILKIYFPEQFSEKPFLSYPIGQFILGIYNMWDFKTKQLKINESSLMECAVSGIFKIKDDINILEILNKVKLYFSDIESITDYYQRIRILENSLDKIKNDKTYESLRMISFFNMSKNELNILKDFLIFIDEISNKLFIDNNNIVDYGKHFQILIEIISKPSINNVAVSKTEKTLIHELSNKLSLCKEGKIKGSIEDVKEALGFYLTGNKNKSYSNWIVRDFEQIDGAVLLSNNNSSKYHFALLSNSHMNKQNLEALPWPLNEEMFLEYLDAKSSVAVVTKGLLERRNFLKYTLFYGLFFTKCDIELSYILEEDAEEQSMYYLLKVLGLETKLFNENTNISFETDDIYKKLEKEVNASNLSFDDKELFSICPYKFLQNKIIKSPILYYSEYHIKYFVSFFIFLFILRTDIKSIYDKECDFSKKITDILDFFPFWGKGTAIDIEKNIKKQIQDYLSFKSKSKKYFEKYIIRKQNFLIAQWKDYDSKQNCMIYDKDNLDNLIHEYIYSSQIYPGRNQLPHSKVCENCNYSNVCLRNYYNTHIEERI